MAGQRQPAAERCERCQGARVDARRYYYEVSGGCAAHGFARGATGLMDQEEARTRCLSRPPKRYEIYSNKRRCRDSCAPPAAGAGARMPRATSASTLQPIEESNSGKSGECEFWRVFPVRLDVYFSFVIFLVIFLLC